MSIIKIYKTEITPERNANLPNSISDYLSGLTPTYSNETFQYIKLGLDINIKIDVNQEAVGESIGNYVDLYQDGKHFYFFIMKPNWKSKECVELVLSMDTVITFDGDFTFNKKTNIIRQHKDRFNGSHEETKTEMVHEYIGTSTLANWDIDLSEYLVDGYEYKSSSSTVGGGPGLATELWNPETKILTIHWFAIEAGHEFTVRTNVVFERKILEANIDRIDEGISSVLYGKEIGTINADEQSWYLIYKSNAGADMFLTSDNGFKVSIAGAASPFTINASDLETNKEYYIDFGDITHPTPVSADEFNNVNVYATDDDTAGGNKVAEKDVVWWKEISSIRARMVVYRKAANGNIEMAWKYYKKVGAFWDFSYNGNWLNTGRTKIFLDTVKTFVIYEGSFNNSRSVIRTYTNVTKSLTRETKDVSQFSLIDRTQQELIKIIKLPYCPIEYTDIDGVLYFNQLVQYDSTLNLVRLPKDIQLDRHIKSELDNILQIKIAGDLSPTNLRHKEYETKMYHSAFYQPKFVYDSFNFIFALENVTTVPTEDKFNFNYNVSKNINSNMMFTFTDYKCEDRLTQDYNDILVVNRNNEVALYTDDYLNYLRTGYNYDVKSKNRQTAINWALFGVSLASGIVSTAIGGGFGKAAGITLIGSAIAQLTNTINSSVTSEVSIQQKLEQSRMQGTSVSNCEDIDLLDVYTNGNKAKLMVYQASDTVKDLVNDLFYYCGYKVDKQGIPDVESRYWFNYIQCEPVFNEEETTPYNDYLADIKARYQAGVTVYHRHNGSYDWEQKYENIENSLL